MRICECQRSIFKTKQLINLSGIFINNQLILKIDVKVDVLKMIDYKVLLREKTRRITKNMFKKDVTYKYI